MNIISNSAYDLMIQSNSVVFPHAVTPAIICIQQGKITQILKQQELTAAIKASAKEFLDVENLVVAPGIVDAHAHINEPGRTEWEGFYTATQAAAAGGITTVVDMPLNCIPATTTVAAAETKQRALENQLYANIAFWGGVVPHNLNDLRGLRDFGVAGCKCFLCPSGVDEFPHVTRAHLEDALPRMRDLAMPLLVHAESPGVLDEAEQALLKNPSDPSLYSTYAASRPAAAEDHAITMIIDLCKKHRAQAHIVHLASASAIPLIAQAQAEGVAISAETCLHYLTFSSEDIAQGQTHFKCAPPIRDTQNKEGLWDGLHNGIVNMIVSDHSPCTPQLKNMGLHPHEGNFMTAWGGISSLQFGLSILLSQCSARGYNLSQMFQWNALHTAQLAGLHNRKGSLTVGKDADIVIFDDKASLRIEEHMIRHKHKLTPYKGRTLQGVVHATYIEGKKVYDKNQGVLSKPLGRFLQRTFS